MGSAVFPTFAGLEYSVVRTPIGGKTLVQTTASGDETRVLLTSARKWQWTLSFNFLRGSNAYNNGVQDEMKLLTGFIMARHGSWDSFLYDDPDDDTATNQFIANGDGSTRIFQLVRTRGGVAEPILAPNAATVQVFINGVLFSPTLSAGGIITFAAAPGSGLPITWSGSYYWPVRFMSDQYDFSKILDQLWEQKKLDFISLTNYP